MKIKRVKTTKQVIKVVVGALVVTTLSVSMLAGCVKKEETLTILGYDDQSGGFVVRSYNELVTIWSVCVYLWEQMGLQIIVYFIGLTLIDPHIDEAAQVDGAGYSRANAENVLGSLGYKFDYTDNISGGKKVSVKINTSTWVLSGS